MKLFQRILCLLLAICLSAGMLPQTAVRANAAEVTETVPAETLPPPTVPPETEEILPTEEDLPPEETVPAPAPVMADDAQVELDFAYVIDQDAGTATVTGYTGTETELVIPETLGGCPVTIIGERAFHAKDTITSVALPESITSIEADAFSYCYVLESISLSDGVTAIGDYAFHECDALTTVTIPASVVSIGKGSFRSCGLESITLSEGLETTGYEAFAHNPLKSIVIPDSVTELGSRAFYYCELLSQVTLPAALSSIAEETFSYCYQLKSIEIPESVTAIENYAFAECDILEAVTVPAKVTRLGDGAFRSCDQMTRVSLPEGLTSIGRDAFAHCILLAEINLPESLTSLGSRVFDSCRSLQSITIPAGVTVLPSYTFISCTALQQVVLPDTMTRIAEFAFYECSGLTSMPEARGLTRIDRWAFYNCDNLTQADIPDPVTSIGDNAFFSCEALTSLTLPEGLKELGRDAFGSCKALTAVSIPAGLEHFGTAAFSGCENLTTVTLPEGLTVLGETAFASCWALTSIRIPDSITEIPGYSFHGCSSLSQVELPKSLAKIGAYAFSGCGNLKSIVLPQTLSDISWHAFDGCGLTAIEIPGSVKTIGEQAFSGCSQLETLTLHEGLTTIGTYVFHGCTSLKSLSLPDTVTRVGGCAFQGCTSLEAVKLSESMTAIESSTFTNCTSLKSIVIPASIRSITGFRNCGLESVTILGNDVTIEAAAFDSCKSLTTIHWPERVTAIKDSAFRSCSALTEFTFPDGLTTVTGEVLYYCTALKQVSLPDSITTIEARAFSGCSSLASIELPKNLTKLAEEVFSHSGLESIRIPEGITTVEYRLLGDCTSLTQVQLPSTITSISQMAFERCSSLKEISLPEGTTQIGRSAFENCHSLEQVILPSTLQSIGSSAFNGCAALKSITIPDSVTTLENSAFAGCSSLEEVTVGSGITMLDSYTFDRCTSLTKVTLSEGLTELKWGTFQNCDALTTVTLPQSVTTLDSAVFHNCDSLEKIVIPDKVTQIQSYTFSKCANLKSVFIHADVTFIDDGAFTECPKLTIYGLPDSYAQTYAAKLGIPFAGISEGGRELTLSVVTEDGNPISSGYEIQWYAGEELIGTGSSLWIEDPQKEYACQILLNEELSYQYYQPEKYTLTLQENESALTCTLYAIPTITLTGRLLTDAGAGVPGNITVLQTFNSQYHREVTASAAADGTFSVKTAAVPVTVTMGAEGFRNRAVSLELSSRPADLDLGDLTLSKLPSNKITLSLTLTGAAAPGETGSTAVLTNFDGLEFAVTNTTQGKDLTGFTLQYPYLLLEDGQANGGDTLRLSVAAQEKNMVSSPIMITLDAQSNGSGSITFREHGRFTIDRLTGNTENTVLIFDAAGNLVSSASAASAYQSDALAEGTYQVVVLKKTNLLRSTSNATDLTTYGLKAGMDYIQKSVTIQNGVIANLGTLAVPVLNEDRLYYTVDKSTSFTASTYSTFAGKYVMFRAEYEIQEKYASSSQQVIFRLPEGLSPANGSLTVDSKPATYSIQGNQILVNVNKPKGTVRFYLYGSNVGTFPISADLRFTLGGGQVTQPLGTIELELVSARFDLPEWTGHDMVAVAGLAIPNSTVTFYDGDTPIGTTTANENGNWYISLTIEEPGDFSYHDISASVYNEKVGTDLSTKSQSLVYQRSYIMPVKVTMYSNYHGNGQNEIIFDFQNQTQTPSYMYDPNYPDFTFVTELSEGADDTNVKQVTVITTDASGSKTYIPSTYDKTKNVWIGTHRFSSPDSIPCSVTVDLTRATQSQDFVLDRNTVGQFQDFMQQQLDRYEQEKQDYFSGIQGQIPDYGSMSMDELYGLSGDIQTDMDLWTGNWNDYWNGFQEDHGLTIEPRDDGVTIRSEDLEWHSTYGNTEGMTEQSLLDQGYEKIPTSDGGYIYEKSDGTSSSIVDLEGGYSSNTKVTGPGGAPSEDYGITQEDITQAGMLMNDAFGSLMEEMQTNGRFDRLQKGMRLNQAQTEKFIGAFEDELARLKASGADPQRIKNMEDMLGKLKGSAGKMKNASGLIDDLGKAGAISRAAGPALGALGLANDIAQGIQKRDEGSNAARDMDRLKSQCQNNPEYDALRGRLRDINNKRRNLSAGVATAGTAGLFVAAASGGTAALIGLGISGTALATQLTYGKWLDGQFQDVKDQINSLDCDGDGIPDLPQIKGEVGNYPVTGILDPSGYVYEAVPSNRVEGVKAEIYYAEPVMDDYGFPTGQYREILWDAASYEQVNPQYTDASGGYRWDVPFGLWLVKYSKEGYHDTDSRSDPAANEAGYLPVPPPQVEVNTAIVSKAAPTVASVNVYQDEVQIIFSQYMTMDSVNTGNVTVTSGGKPVSGKLEPANAESNCEGTARYASVFRFVPDSPLSGQAAVSVRDAVNYAGTKLESPYSVTKPVQIRPRSISAGSDWKVAYNGKSSFEIQILPAEAGANQTLTVSSSAPSIVSASAQSVRTAADGTAVITLEGNLPGSAHITISLDGTDLATTTGAIVSMEPIPEESACAKVEASIPSGSVVKPGTQLTLRTATSGASIYYTLDGTCPCEVNSPSRQLYTGPITIQEDMFLIAYAVKSGMKDSKTAAFTYTVASETTITRIAGDGRCQTAMEAAEELKKIQGVEKFRTILVADGNNYPDALSGSYLAAVADAPILLVQANQKKVTQTVKEYILSNLTADATVYILGGTNSIPTDFEASIASAGYTVKRLAGNDRYLTSLMIIQEGDALLVQQGNAPADSLLVCAGGGYADSLSASATGRPVLLVNGGKTALTTSQKNYLDTIGKRSIYIIGGPNSVSNAIATQLNAYDTDSATKRIAGDGREETSAKVAQEFFPNATFAVLADGNNYPDGLSGGPVAYAKQAPLLLIRAKRESYAKDFVGNRIKEGYILGGPNSVSDNSAKVIFGENAIIK